LAYIPPTVLDYDILDCIEGDIVKYKNLDDIILCGDFNARVGSMSDFKRNDDFLPLSDDYCKDTCVTERICQNSVIDNRGKGLIDICIGNQLRMLNDRMFGDMFGKCTCYTPNGSSRVATR
jgi:hypothetical protein